MFRNPAIEAYLKALPPQRVQKADESNEEYRAAVQALWDFDEDAFNRFEEERLRQEYDH